MQKQPGVINQTQPLLQLAQRVGSDPLLTQASTGNCSAKLDGVLWIKASGKWMADAISDNILIPLELAEIRDCLRRGIDPSEHDPDASVETAMHATLPHPVVLHVHCVNTIAWAVRNDAPLHLQRLLKGLPWDWIPYTASGIPLALKIDQALAVRSGTNLFVLGNHGLVIGGEDVGAVEELLNEVTRRLTIAPRQAHPADYAALAEIARDRRWELPDDDETHALGTDRRTQSILAEGLLYPCQAIFSNANTSSPFRAIPYYDANECRQNQYGDRGFLIFEGRGVVVNRSIAPTELAMISGLARVVQRLDAPSFLRYLTEAELSSISGRVVARYRAHANRRRREIRSRDQSA